MHYLLKNSKIIFILELEFYQKDFDKFNNDYSSEKELQKLNDAIKNIR